LLPVAAGRKGGIRRHERHFAGQRHAGGQRYKVLLGDADFDEALWVAFGKLDHTGGLSEIGA